MVLFFVFHFHKIYFFSFYKERFFFISFLQYYWSIQLHIIKFIPFFIFYVFLQIFMKMYKKNVRGVFSTLCWTNVDWVWAGKALQINFFCCFVHIFTWLRLNIPKIPLFSVRNIFSRFLSSLNFHGNFFFINSQWSLATKYV